MDPVDVFKQLSDETRLRCVCLLVREGELCVCELTYALGLSQPKISRHLAHLRDLELVASRKQGQWVYYSIHRGLPAWVDEVLKTVSRSAVDRNPYRGDIDRLRQMPALPGSSGCT